MGEDRKAPGREEVEVTDRLKEGLERPKGLTIEEKEWL